MAGTIGGLIGRVLATPLPSPYGGFTRCTFPGQTGSVNLNFISPFGGSTPQGLGKISADHDRTGMPGGFPARLENRIFSRTKGSCKGFIDPVFQFQGRFFLVDWEIYDSWERGWRTTTRSSCPGQCQSAIATACSWVSNALALHRI